MGRSGAGKSTLVKLLLRFYDTESGRILVDGQDISEVTQSSLRRQIGMVQQDTALLHRSVRDNILYGDPSASEEQMEKAQFRPRTLFLSLRTRTATKAMRRWPLTRREALAVSASVSRRPVIRRTRRSVDEATSALDSEGRPPFRRLSPR